MIRKEVMQDHLGNRIYWHTSSDIVVDTTTGKTVKQDLDAIKKALGVEYSCGTETGITINADKVGGLTADELVGKAVEQVSNLIVASASEPADTTKIWIDTSSGSGVLKYYDGEWKTLS